MTRHKKILTMSRKVSKRVTDEQGNLTRCRNVNVQVYFLNYHIEFTVMINNDGRYIPSVGDDDAHAVRQ